jgi:hypothetical protein
MKAIRFSTLFIAIAIISIQCTAQNWGTGIKGEGPKVTKNLDIASFDGIGLSISADVYVRQGSPQSVKIEAQQNIIDNLERNVSNGVWKISFDKNVRGHDGVKIWITVSDLNKIAVSGSGDVIGEGKFNNLGSLDLSISGSGNINLNANSKSLSAAISGSGDMKLMGETGDCEMKITGSGDISAFDLDAKSCAVKITGSGDSSVNVRENLDVSIVGSGDVFYKGRPSVRSKITGSGDVQSK